ncbi:AAA family ATPase [Streptomyces sp. NBC_01622]|uniref:ATP-binding protein n=1 Tax=Streptomyces sp. NBC_01622 TaxID=2975903 RepID=UPI00386FB6B1|nr:AAA family ATPase [Streptomyces sp. NBC_01622]
MDTWADERVGSAGELLEREEELGALRAAIDAARDGAGTVVVLQGPPGVGKTRLLAAADHYARMAGLRVLAGRGRELERQIALGVAVELLSPPVAAADARERARLLTGLAALTAPLLLEAGAHGITAPTPTADATLLGLCWLTAHLSGWDLPDGTSRPVLLAVDDAQWADAASLRFLAMLADRVDELALTLVITVREGEDGSGESMLHKLAAHPHGRLLTPAPLTTGAVNLLVTSAFPAADGELGAAVARASGGNPFLVGELLRSLRADGLSPVPSAVAGLLPDTVLRSVLARMARLPAEAGRLAAAVAVLGDGTPLRRAAAHATLDLPSAERAADVLAEAHLLLPGNPLTFTHPLIAAAVHADVPAFERARAHRRAADLLAADGEGVDRVAGHLLATEPAGDAATVAVLREASGRALRRGDPAAAARLLHRALAEPARERGELLVELARAQLTGGDMAAHDSLTEALTLLGRAAPHERAQALGMLAHACHARGDFPAGAAASEEALDLLPPHDPVWQGLLADYLTIATFYPPLLAKADLRLLPVLAAARGANPPSRPSLLAHVALRLALAGDPACDVRRLADAALADDVLPPPAGHGALTGIVLHALVICGELDAAQQAADAAVTAARRRGDLLAYANANYHRALSRYHQGALAPALADLAAAQTAHAAGWSAGNGWIGSLLAQLHLERGDLAAAREALRLADQHPAVSMDAALVLHARARLALAEHDPSTAFAAARAAGRHLEQDYRIDHPGLLPWRTTAALAAHHLGDHRQAQELADQALDRARAVGVAQAVGVALRTAGTVARPRPDLDRLAEAAAVLRGTPAALEYAHSLVDLGAALRRSGQRDACREPLRQGLALADGMHARPLAERARTELHGIGVRPRRTAVEGVGALTPAESRVALLALHGDSNSQIAQALFITTKTVETHLARAYRKLAISNRGQLQVAFAHHPQSQA